MGSENGAASAWVAGLVNAPVDLGAPSAPFGAPAAFADSIHDSMDALEQMRALQQRAARSCDT